MEAVRGLGGTCIPASALEIGLPASRNKLLYTVTTYTVNGLKKSRAVHRVIQVAPEHAAWGTIVLGYHMLHESKMDTGGRVASPTLCYWIEIIA